MQRLIGKHNLITAPLMAHHLAKIIHDMILKVFFLIIIISNAILNMEVKG